MYMSGVDVQAKLCRRVGKGSGVYLAAVLEVSPQHASQKSTRAEYLVSFGKTLL